MKLHWFSKQKMTIGLLFIASCGGGGEGDSTAPAAAVTPVIPFVSGSIKSASGSQSELADWSIFGFDYNAGIGSLGTINASGAYSLDNLDAANATSLVLLDPQFRLAAVLSAPGAPSSNTIKQAFRFATPAWPTLVHSGPIISFTDTSGLTWLEPLAKDSDGDGIPDGLELLAEIDTDGDKIPNNIDSDIDGDGLVNWFDDDDDGDGIPDAFDIDANENTVPDAQEALSDLHFRKHAQYISVQVIQDAQNDGSFRTSLMLVSKAEANTKPKGFSIVGPSSLLEGAEAIHINAASGAEEASPWDYTLADSGVDEDGAAGDGLYAKRIRLATDKFPRSKQTLFFQVTAADNKIYTLPFMFPNIVSGAISGTYTANSRTVTLVGTPFQAAPAFRWSVHIYDSTGRKIFASASLDGQTPSYVVPADVLETGATYTARIVASTPDRIPSYPAWVVRSTSFNL